MTDGTRIYTEGDLQATLKIQDQDNNDYATKKSVAQNHLNVSSFMYLISLSLAIFTSGHPLTSLEITLIVLISLSATLQFVIFTLVTILANSKSEQLTSCCLACSSSKRRFVCTATSVNNLVTSLSGLLLIVTTAITSVSTYARIDGTFPMNSTSK